MIPRNFRSATRTGTGCTTGSADAAGSAKRSPPFSDYLQALVESMPRRLQAVLENGGNATKSIHYPVEKS